MGSSVKYFSLIFSAHRLPQNAKATRRRLMPAVVAAFAVSLSACTSETQSSSDETPVLSAPPATTFPMPPLNARADLGWVLSDGKRATLGDFQGKVLVLDFYATWCAPCRESIPQLITLEKHYGRQGLQLVGLNVGGPDDRVKVAAFARELSIQYPLGFPDQALTDFFLSDNQTIPQTFVFGREGQLLKRFVGHGESSGVELEKVIADAVSSK